MISKEKVTALVESHLAGTPNFPVEIIIRTGNRITVLIDGDRGVSIEVCRELSQFLNKAMDRDQEDYDLTISSAGADQPLKLPRQFSKNTGKQLEVITQDGEKYTGLVMEANDQGIVLERTPAKKKKKEPEETRVTLAYRDIKTAKEVITFKH